MIDTEDTSLVLINYKPEFFNHCFSKMEFLMGMDYINEFIKKYKIPVIFTERELNYKMPDKNLNEIRNKKEENRRKNMVLPSEYDKKFLDEFKNKITVKNPVIVQREDIFYESKFMDEINKYGRKTLLFGGFFTDTDVFISSINAGMRDFRSIVVSDISSTYSERLYFQSLEMMSQFIDVIDTRDLMKIFDP